MKKNKNASSLIIAIWLVAVSIMVAYIIMEYMIPFLRNIKWVENSTSSYYHAYSWLERGLYFFSTRSWNLEWSDKGEPFYSWDYNVDNGYEYKTTSSWKTLPAEWTWDSEYDLDYNTISMWNPIQLSVWYGYIQNTADIWNLEIYFKVPNLNLSINERINWQSQDNVINWQLSSNDKTLNSIPDSLIKVEKINNSAISIWSLDGILIDWTLQTFSTFFSTNCISTTSRCILRFSVINPLKEATSKANIPYLEWRIKSPTGIPLRYSRIASTWKSYGFSKTLEIRVPQDTVPEALDFTVFQ
jgi:hypothetical protein